MDAAYRAGERRLLQAAVALACLVPLAMGAAGVARGPDVLHGVAATPADLDSHFRYLSGLLFGIGLAFAWCIPAIERRGTLFRLLGLIVVAGGLARLASLAAVGLPGIGHVFGIVMELGIVPMLMLWQGRVARAA
ncbi:MAG: hypothetical protein QOI38_1153 [Sphingomonadales bacterium]|jgi:hypothetical protein|nr:hypothetical protein [Sphingomonadales bacterium]